MKANESIPKYNARLREYANYAARQDKDVCKVIGPRPAGEEAETKAQERFAEELKKYADAVSVEPFTAHPNAFLGWALPFALVMIAANVLFFFGFAVVSLALAAITLCFVVTEYYLRAGTLDAFFPKRESRNVFAVRKAKGDVKKRIILSGQADSGHIWRFSVAGGQKLVLIFVVGTVVTLAAAIYCVATGNLLHAPKGDIVVMVVKWVLLAWCVEFLVCAFIINRKAPVDGAIDNLSGVFASLAVMKYLSDNDIRFEGVEVCVVITGASECGLRGAKAFAKAHQFDEGETVFIGVDTLHDFDAFAVDAKADPKVSELLSQAAQTADIALADKGLSGDAAVIGLPGATLSAKGAATVKLCGSTADNAENISIKAIEGGVNLLLETVFLCDEQA